jgi:hypothetical protein
MDDINPHNQFWSDGVTYMMYVQLAIDLEREVPLAIYTS